MTLILLGITPVAAGLAVTNERTTDRDEFWFRSELAAAGITWTLFCLAVFP